MKIEITLEKLDKTIAGLVRAMGDDGFEGIVTREVISGDSQRPDEWITDERKKAFEEKFNKELGSEYISYKVISITKIY